jgi:RNA polymerase sigma-70 factor, ECF subfamily
MKKQILINRFSEVYHRYYALIFNALYTKLGNAADAEDLCQEVFIRFYDNFEQVLNHKKWLFATLNYVVLEFLRKKRPQANLDEYTNDISLAYLNGFKDSRLVIEEAFEHMGNFKDEREKVLFNLIAFNRYTYKEAARETGFSQRQAAYRYAKIVERIIAYLQRKGIEGLEDLL